jgi:hypothetical protein
VRQPAAAIADGVGKGRCSMLVILFPVRAAHPQLAVSYSSPRGPAPMKITKRRRSFSRLRTLPVPTH